MTAMTVMSRDGNWMPRDGNWTVDDLRYLPDNGFRYELVDGMLLVSPAPVPVHQRAVLETAVLLRSACSPDLEVFVAPLDYQPSRVSSVQPDVLVVRQDAIGPENVTSGVVLAVEVASPSTRKKDRLLKHALYAESGVPAYWIVDPATPSLTVWQLDGDEYGEPSIVTGEEAYEATAPYPVRVVPAGLIRG